MGKEYPIERRNYIEEGLISPKGKAGHFKTKLKKFKAKKSLQSLTISPVPSLAKLGRSPWRWPI
jgi:hypothetical protein